MKGRHEGDIEVAVASVQIPKDSAGKQIHVILEVNDQHHDVPLTSYRRIVMNVTK